VDKFYVGKNLTEARMRVPFDSNQAAHAYASQLGLNVYTHGEAFPHDDSDSYENRHDPGPSMIEVEHVALAIAEAPHAFAGTEGIKLFVDNLIHVLSQDGALRDRDRMHDELMHYMIRQ